MPALFRALAAYLDRCERTKVFVMAFFGMLALLSLSTGAYSRNATFTPLTIVAALGFALAMLAVFELLQRREHRKYG